MTELRDPQRLFRAEALAYLDRSADGRVMLVQPLSHTLLTLVILSLFAGIIGVGINTSYRRSDLADGVLVYRSDSVRVKADHDGLVASVLVEEGARVAAEDRLVLVERPAFDMGGHRISELNRHQIESARTLLERQRSVLIRRRKAEERALDARLARARQTIRVQKDLLKLTDAKLELSLEESKAARALEADGSVSRATARKKELEHLDLRLALQRLEGERLASLAEIEAIAAERSRKQTEWDQATHDLDLKIAEIDERLLRVATEDIRAVKAPISGIVANMTAATGERVVAGRTLMLIVPDSPDGGGGLEAEVYVPPRAVGFVRPGQSVRLQYDAFPYQRYGYFEGTIRSASKSTFTSAEVEGAQRVDGPFYRVMVDLRDQAVAADLSLRAGMTLKASLVSEERSLLAWVLEPAIAVQRRLAR